MGFWKSFKETWKNQFAEPEKPIEVPTPPPKEVPFNNVKIVFNRENYVEPERVREVWNPDNLDRPQEVINGWKLIGIFRHRNGVTKLQEAFGEKIPENYFISPQKCDHCSKELVRRITYIIQNVRTLEIKQVGSSCIKKFLNL